LSAQRLGHPSKMNTSIPERTQQRWTDGPRSTGGQTFLGYDQSSCAHSYDEDTSRGVEYRYNPRREVIRTGIKSGNFFEKVGATAPLLGCSKNASNSSLPLQLEKLRCKFCCLRATGIAPFYANYGFHPIGNTSAATIYNIKSTTISR
jgi:hypothetical protein